MQSIKQIRDGLSSMGCMVCLYTCVYDSVFIPVCMIDSRRLETNPRLWVVRALVGWS